MKNQTNRKKYQVHNNNKSKKIRGGIAPVLLLIENIPSIASYTLTGFDTLMRWLNTANTAIGTYDKIKHPASASHPVLIVEPTPVSVSKKPPVNTAPTPVPVTKKPPVKTPPTSVPVTKKK